MSKRLQETIDSPPWAVPAALVPFPHTGDILVLREHSMEQLCNGTGPLVVRVLLLTLWRVAEGNKSQALH